MKESDVKFLDHEEEITDEAADRVPAVAKIYNLLVSYNVDRASAQMIAPIMVEMARSRKAYDVAEAKRKFPALRLTYRRLRGFYFALRESVRSSK